MGLFGQDWPIIFAFEAKAVLDKGLNQLIMCFLLALRHRELLGLLDDEVFGLVQTGDTVKMYRAAFKGKKPKRYLVSCKKKGSRNWS